MVHWFWLIPVALISVIAGMMLISLCVISSRSDLPEDFGKADFPTGEVP
jgi:hypothetical protein